jgi:phage/plasmid-associated DNA primase
MTDDPPDIDDPDEYADRARNTVISFLEHDLDDYDDGAERFTAEFDHLDAFAEDIALAIDAGMGEHRKSRYAEAVSQYSDDNKTSIEATIDEKLADIKRGRIADHESGITDTDAFAELATMSSETAAKNTRRVRELGAEAFIQTDDEHFATPRVEGGEVNKTSLYRYDQTTGAYEPTGDARVHELLAELLDVMHTADINEVVNRLKRRSFVDRDAFDAGDDERDLINLADCVLDISDPADPERVEHSPEFLFRTAIPRRFDEGGECPAIDAFMQEVCPDDVARKTLYEWIGFCLQPGYQLHRFLLLTGSGGNGKGVFFRLLRIFLGEDNAG